jgi:hypothetical protein
MTEEQQRQAQIYAYSVKIDTTAKGVAMPTIHVYSNDMETARKEAVEQYAKTFQDLEARGFTVTAHHHNHGGDLS